MPKEKLSTKRREETGGEKRPRLAAYTPGYNTGDGETGRLEQEQVSAKPNVLR